ncbi:MAG: TetR/AcrR family transcriptional regulator [Pseudoprimorskyibacter sp.]|nr:TetR/AcrR family transcriptional regulator [Pseudoprimorskyibacter sp.]
MTERDVLILNAAEAVFSRYGVSKTTMHDIAVAAGVSRQTLYNAYPNKKEILRATFRMGAAKIMAAVEEKWDQQQHLAEKLDTFFELGPLALYDVIQSSPEAADLIDGINTIAHDELIELSKIWIKMFEAAISAHIPPDSPSRFNINELADFVYFSSLNAKYYAANRHVLSSRLQILKASVLSMLENPAV